jgi:hypothetical protein
MVLSVASHTCVVSCGHTDIDEGPRDVGSAGVEARVGLEAGGAGAICMVSCAELRPTSSSSPQDS